jgi:deoxyadenosine/deoxycytidine kinase
LNYLVIEGNIGAGKTSLASRLAQDLKAKLILESFSENPFLPKFYQDPSRFSFPLELSFLAERYRQHREELVSRDMFAPLSIADYYFSKSLIFASITLQQDEYTLYRQLYNIIHQHLPAPDLYVYLHVPVNKLLENIHKRGRDYEKEISQEYLKQLQDKYFEFMKSQTGWKFLVIDTEELDFVSNTEHYEKLKSIIFSGNHPVGINRYL